LKILAMSLSRVREEVLNWDHRWSAVYLEGMGRCDG
jgi:hypothetical protein